MNQLGIIASGILEYDFDFIPDGPEKQSELLLISGTLSGRIGELNDLIHQKFHFTGSNGNVNPPLQNEESAILRKIYMRDWAKKQAQKVLRGLYLDSTPSGNSSAGDWIELSEGDTTIRRSASSSAASAASRINTQRGFRDLAKDIQEELKELIYRYNIYGGQPRQVISEDCPISVEASSSSEKEIIYVELEAQISGSGISGSGISGSGISGSGLMDLNVSGSGISGSGISGSEFFGSGISGSGIFGSGISGSGIY